MPWYISIILGFVFIGVGIVTWLNGNIVEKWYEAEKTTFVNHKNEIIEWRIGEYILQNYKLTPKDNHGINKGG